MLLDGGELGGWRLPSPKTIELMASDHIGDMPRAGTRFWIDPEEEMVTLFMIQILPHEGLTFGSEFKALAYQAIVD
jgi:CubicO group peptidase (beta-lactamase class C family)